VWLEPGDFFERIKRSSFPKTRDSIRSILSDPSAIFFNASILIFKIFSSGAIFTPSAKAAPGVQEYTNFHFYTWFNFCTWFIFCSRCSTDHQVYFLHLLSFLHLVSFLQELLDFHLIPF